MLSKKPRNHGKGGIPTSGGGGLWPSLWKTSLDNNMDEEKKRGQRFPRFWRSIGMAARCKVRGRRQSDKVEQSDLLPVVTTGPHLPALKQILLKMFALHCRAAHWIVGGEGEIIKRGGEAIETSELLRPGGAKPKHGSVRGETGQTIQCLLAGGLAL